MSTSSSDRDQMRKELRELARLANAKPRELNYFTEVPDYRTSREQSGFVDLAGFNASDPRWVEKELVRTSAPDPKPGPEVDVVVAAPAVKVELAAEAPRAIDQLAAGSLSPLAMTSLLEADDGNTGSVTRTGIGRKRGMRFVFSGVGAACALLLAAAVVRGFSSSDDASAASSSANTESAASPASHRTPGPPAIAARRVDAKRDGVREAPPAPPPPESVPAAPVSPRPPPVQRASSAPPPPARVAAAAPKHDHAQPKPALAAVVIPPSKPVAGDPLVAAIQQSIKKKH